MDSEDKALFLESLSGIVRDQRDRLDDALREFGWHDLLFEDPGAAVSILLELTGRHLSDHRALDSVGLDALGRARDPGTAVVHPLPAEPRPTSLIEAQAPRALVLRGIVCARRTPPTRVVVPAVEGDRVVIATAAWRGPWPDEGTGTDPSGGLTPLNGLLTIDASALVTGEAAAKLWERLRAAMHRALAHHLAGVGSTMLELATEHVKARSQFGRPLASFQAVKHRLADVGLWQECARLAADGAWESLAMPDEHIAATLAKSTANRFTRLAREHCRQVLGGMGFTWEHDFHRYVRRALVVEPLYGSTPQLHGLLGRSIRPEGAPPRLAPL